MARTKETFQHFLVAREGVGAFGQQFSRVISHNFQVTLLVSQSQVDFGVQIPS